MCSAVCVAVVLIFVVLSWHGHLHGPLDSAEGSQFYQRRSCGQPRPCCRSLLLRLHRRQELSGAWGGSVSNNADMALCVISGVYVCMGTPLDIFRSTDRLYNSTWQLQNWLWSIKNHTISELKGRDRACWSLVIADLNRRQPPKPGNGQNRNPLSPHISLFRRIMKTWVSCFPGIRPMCWCLLKNHYLVYSTKLGLAQLKW